VNDEIVKEGMEEKSWEKKKKSPVDSPKATPFPL